MSVIPERDRIFAKKLKETQSFAFNDEVTAVFDDMIHRSVPGYSEILDFIQIFSSKHIDSNCNCYDLGTSLGAVARRLQKGINCANCTIYAVDSSSSMIQSCRKWQNSQKSNFSCEIIYLEKDICKLEIENAGIVVLNFTLQFIDPSQRLPLLQRIHTGLRESAYCIISEKLDTVDSYQQKLLTEMHEEFKKFQGYSNLEISQKRRSLEAVLIPNTKPELIELLHKAGFSQCIHWYQNRVFHSFVAKK